MCSTILGVWLEYKLFAFMVHVVANCGEIVYYGTCTLTFQHTNMLGCLKRLREIFNLVKRRGIATWKCHSRFTTEIFDLWVETIFELLKYNVRPNMFSYIAYYELKCMSSYYRLTYRVMGKFKISVWIPFLWPMELLFITTFEYEVHVYILYCNWKYST